MNIQVIFSFFDLFSSYKYQKKLNKKINKKLFIDISRFILDIINKKSRILINKDIIIYRISNNKYIYKYCKKENYIINKY
jgi:hypothetical protein